MEANLYTTLAVVNAATGTFWYALIGGEPVHCFGLPAILLSAAVQLVPFK